MTSHKTILVTGALGEMGHSLINYFFAKGGCKVIALDLRDPEKRLPGVTYINGSVADKILISSLSNNHEIDVIFHLAAILSTGGERDPIRAHQVNVDGGLNILELARTIGQSRRRPVKVIFPSTIAVYGIADLDTKQKLGKISEEQCLTPITMYGINKLYVERLGTYYDSYFRFLDNPTPGEYVDFRALRYPGILSAETIPTGGTSDYGPEMLHAAARGVDYSCFVKPDTRIPFMVMPDAVKALIFLAEAERSALQQRIYNISGFAPSAAEIEAEIKKYFSTFVVAYQPDQQRLKIVESWPENIDDGAARRDFDWQPDYDFAAAFARYLVPAVKRRYAEIIFQSAVGQ